MKRIKLIPLEEFMQKTQQTFEQLEFPGWSTPSFIPKGCEKCPNHPSNGGSGLCNCVIPYMTTTNGIGETWWI